MALAVPTRRNGGISADGKTITYRLRRGVTFSDGVPLTARDVVYTWRAMLDPAHDVAYRYPYDVATSVTAPDPQTVVVKLRAPSAPFLSFFCAQNGRGSILPEHLLAHGADFNRGPYNHQPIGSGAFVVQSYEAGSKLVLAANPRFWRGRPKLDRIEFDIIARDTALQTALQSHSIDMYYDVSKPQVAYVRTFPGVRVTAKAIADFEHISFNCARAPFDDVRARRAVAYAVDWHGIFTRNYRGLGVENPSDVTPDTWASDPALRGYPFDPAKARAILASAGWRPGADGVLERDGTRFAVVISTVAGIGEREATEVLMQQQLRAVGIALEVKNYPASLFFSAASAGGIINSGKFDLALSAWAKGPEVDDEATIGPNRIPPAGGNDSFYRDPVIGAALAHAGAAYERSVRRPFYYAIQRRERSEVPFYTLIWLDLVMAFDDDLHGVEPTNGASEFWNAWQWSI